jgi:hypothetical protein
MDDMPQILVSAEVRESLRIIGKKGDTYTKIITFLIEEYTKNTTGR